MEGSAGEPGGARPATSRRGRLRAIDALTLAAIATVVLLVSLPRLKELAVRENEGDAAWLAGRLAQLGTISSAADVQSLVLSSPELDRQLDDVEYLEHGRLLRRHGYLFELGPGQAPCLRAWPWDHGRTGRAVILWTPQSGLRGHPNERGAWSGMQRPPPLEPLGAGWGFVRAR